MIVTAPAFWVSLAPRYGRGMETKRGEVVALPVAALVFAAGAALAFGLGDALEAVSDEAFALSWILGWGLLAWSALLGLLAVALLASRRPLSRTGLGVCLAAVAVIVVVAATHPLVGSGAGTG
ncbi:hypothetical protein NB037_17405 [Rathayibacter sp. ZW T2_19]|uniref:Uncharacterized protein n=1 Tax=Rathayibacter rubneri TaxID=2950106 RepID=A0A9X2DZX9_9MICO|nr:hypothetical protein [Rathayibacter rubneri]MCM6764195.1 hypothetical protein [Rathayibacter rubneri]